MQTRSMQTREARKWVDRAIIAVLLLMGIAMLMPFFWLFSMSFRPAAEAYKMPPSFFPPSFDLTNYQTVLDSSVPFLRIYWNSLYVAVLVTIGQLVTCTLAAFAYARLRFPGRDSLFFVMLIGLMFPAQVTILPIYLGYAKLGLLNNPLGLVLMGLTSSFGVFMLRQLSPALGALAIITFTGAWNSYFQPRALIESQASMTLPIAMDLLRGYMSQGNLSVVMAAMSMAILPVVLLFLVAQRMVIEGVTFSGIRA